MTTKEFLFVYGSFCKGWSHYQMLEPYVRSTHAAYVIGSVYRLPVGYPVFLNRGEQRVSGQCLEIESSSELFGKLDEFHGVHPQLPEKSLFFREYCEVGVQGAPTQVKALIYVFNPIKLPRTAQPINDGNWSRSLSENPALPEKLSDRQARYVRRLGASTGREIVPINLDLYRELMKLELIVDKGRRLALTKLGKEVYRFLPQSSGK